MRRQAGSLLLSAARRAERAAKSSNLCNPSFDLAPRRLVEPLHPCGTPVPSAAAPKLSLQEWRFSSAPSSLRDWAVASQLQPRSSFHSSAPLAAPASSKGSGKKNKGSKQSSSASGKSQQSKQQQQPKQQQAKQEAQQQPKKEQSQQQAQEQPKKDQQTKQQQQQQQQHAKAQAQEQPKQKAQQQPKEREKQQAQKQQQQQQSEQKEGKLQEQQSKQQQQQQQVAKTQDQQVKQRTQQQAKQQQQQQLKLGKQEDQKAAGVGGKPAGKAVSPSSASTPRQAQGSSAAAVAAADDLQKLEAILGLSSDDLDEPLKKPATVAKRMGLPRGVAVMEEEEDEERWEQPTRALSVQDEIEALRQSGKISEDAFKQIQVFDLDAEGAGDEGTFKIRPDRIYYPGQLYAPEELDFSQPLPEESAALMRRQDREVNSKEILRAADFRNVRVLSRFLSPTAKILPRYKTKLSAKAQRTVAREIRISRAFGLMPFTRIGQPPFRFRIETETEPVDNLDSLKNPVDL